MKHNPVGYCKGQRQWQMGKNSMDYKMLWTRTAFFCEYDCLNQRLGRTWFSFQLLNSKPRWPRVNQLSSLSTFSSVICACWEKKNRIEEDADNTPSPCLSCSRHSKKKKKHHDLLIHRCDSK